MAVIDVNDVATAIGRPISDSDEQNQVAQWIDDVELLIEARLGDLTALSQPLLAYVVREAVIARMRYRDDRNSQRTTGEDESDTGEEHYFLRVLNPWWALLSPPTNAATSAFSIRPFFEADDVPSSVTTPPSSEWTSVDWRTEPWV